MPQNILVIRLSSLGDIVLTAPVYRSLKAAWPDSSITALVKPAFAQALEGNPHISEIIHYENLFSALKAIRSRHFTHLLDLHANLRSFLIRKFAGISAVSVYRKDALARRLFVAFGRPSPVLQKYNLERYLEALEAWGIRMVGHDWRLRLTDQNQARGTGRAEEVHNVLLIQSAFLGDSLTTLPLAREIKSNFPAGRLTVLSRENTAEIFQDSPWVDEVIIDHKRSEHSGLSGLWRLSRLLKSRGFDWAIVPHRSFRSALLAYLCAIPQRVGFAWGIGRFFFTHRVAFSWLMHDLERNLSLLLPLTPDLELRSDVSLYLEHSREPDLALERKLKEAGAALSAPMIGIHPGSRWPTKRWLPDRFAEISRRLKAAGYEVALIGAKEDRQLCADLAGESGAVNLAGKTNLSELKSLIGRLSLFLTNDSGPMHFAVGLGVPTLAIFGATTRELGFFPYGPKHRVMEAQLDCRPCSLHGGPSCPQGHFLCMRLITVDEVWNSVEEMLRASARPLAVSILP